MMEKLRKRKPKFRRQEWFRFKRLGEVWRKPRGRDSKMRRGIRGKPAMPSVGYRMPKRLRGLHPSGMVEVLVHNLDKLRRVDPKRQVVRIASAVGGRKRKQILELAKELGVRVLNPRGEGREAEHAEKAGG